METTYNFPVWATQGGGLVKEVNGAFVFIEAPKNLPHLNVGDTMPEEWGIIPANQLARDSEHRWTAEDQRLFDQGCEQVFDILIDKAKSGKISFDEVRSFIPKEVRERNVL